MAKLSKSTLAGLKKEELVDYAVQLQDEKKGGWHGGHFAAILAALVFGYALSSVIPGVNLSGAKKARPATAPKRTASSPTPVPSSPPLSVKNLKKLAASLKLDTAKFNTCLDSGKYEQAVKDDFAAGSKAGVNGTPSFFINGVRLQGAQPFDRFKSVIDQALAGEKGKANIKFGSLPAKGSDRAPVTIVEFSDFQCPFCGRFFAQTLPQIRKEYIDTGKVKIYYRDFPLTNIHRYAQKAAEAARCANEQNKFWEYHDLIFGSQT